MGGEMLSANACNARRAGWRVALMGALALAGLVGLRPAIAAVFPVAPAAETDPVPSSGDAADDAAIWVHPTDPARSTIIGTDKQGGLAVYDQVGRELYYYPDGKMNNVDLRYDFPLGDARVALVGASKGGSPATLEF